MLVLLRWMCLSNAKLLGASLGVPPDTMPLRLAVLGRASPAPTTAELPVVFAAPIVAISPSLPMC